MNYTTLFIVGFLIYIVCLTAIGYMTSRSQNSGENFVNGGNTLSMLPLVGTIGATIIGTASSLGATANGYRYGWGGSIFAIGSMLGLIGLNLYVPVRKFGFNTVSEEAQYYYNGSKAVRTLVAVVATICEVVWVANAIMGGSTYLSYVTGLDNITSKVITTVSFVAFTVFGGYLSVVWTDTIQFGIIIVGFAMIALQALPLAGGMDAVKQAYEAAGNGGALSFYGLKSYGYLPALSLVVTSFLSPMCAQSHHQKIYTSKDMPTARKSFVTAGLLAFAFSFLPSIIGMSVFTITQREGIVLETADFAFVFMVRSVLPPVMGLLFLIAGVSATLSSADTNVIAGTMLVLEDLFPLFTHKKVSDKNYKTYGRILIVVISLFSLLMAMFATDIISFIVSVAGAFVPTLAICLLLGRLWKRATWQGGCACLIMGTLLGLAYLLIPAVKTALTNTMGGISIPVSLISILSCVIVSLCTSDEKKTEEEVLSIIRAN